MKRIQLNFLGLLMIATLAHGSVLAQGTVYLSNLNGVSTGSTSVASDSRLAVEFDTGSNPGGYLLNSVQLVMLDAIGNPDSFSINLCTLVAGFSPKPGLSLGSLIGSTDPGVAGTYTFIPSANLVLLPETRYFIVLSTVGTSPASEAYQWSTTSMSPISPGTDWLAYFPLSSPDGVQWSTTAFGFTQFALDATAIPEPSALALILLCGGVFIHARLNCKHR